MSQTVEERRAFARSGVPREPDARQPLPKRLLTSKLFWLSVVMVLVYLGMLVLLYQQVVLWHIADHAFNITGIIRIVNIEAVN